MKTPQLGNSMQTTLAPAYVTGLSEGLASFTYSRNGNGINLRFTMKMQEQDRDLLFSLMMFFGVGNVYHSKPRDDSPAGRGGSWYYCVTKLSDLERLVRHFEAYPLAGSRARAFEVWKQLFELKRSQRTSDTEALFSLAARLSELSRRRTSTQTASDTEAS
ncbi:MAG: LAGLIDADG family homing endonuclease [Elusimicrobia bacterium]|nr:LAGLIDADG family homing endonuclease [Elusimicrobiota bacterium]